MSTAYITHRPFLGAAAMLFVASALLTIGWCRSMSTMHAMPMPGGWEMSMMWMRMPGRSWPGCAASFLAMWLVMTAAMMLPTLVPMLWRYRRRVAATTAARLDALTALVGAAYFFVWTGFGAAAFAAGSTLAVFEMASTTVARAVPAAIGAIVLIAGALQFTRWKAHHLACCRGEPACCGPIAATTRAAWRHGLRLGVHCVHCCFGLTVVLLAIGMMNLVAMALVTAAICVERLAPGGLRLARGIGVVLLAIGAFLIARALMV
ncbi:MAG TPA: DUF2182 domain-containing protein [Rudaea sp.]